MLFLRQRDRRALAYIQRYPYSYHHPRQPRNTLLYTRRIPCSRRTRHTYRQWQHHHRHRFIGCECVLHLCRDSGGSGFGRHRRDSYVRHRGTLVAGDCSRQQHPDTDPTSTNWRGTAQHTPPQRIYDTNQGIGEITSIWYRIQLPDNLALSGSCFLF